MQTVHDNATLRNTVSGWRAAGERIVFVPTMGNLHAGHMALVAKAKSLGGKTVASIFVNPLQFGAGEDFAAYPRTPAEDAQQLQAAGCDLLYAPETAELYPDGTSLVTQVEVKGLGDILCGESRPGHFTGVATVVAKLFNLVAPDVAVFGEKDYQQLLVVRRMVADLNCPVEIVGVATMRESDGLALSSRNRYLTPPERQLAPQIYQELQRVAAEIRAGTTDFQRLERDSMRRLVMAGLQPEYVSIRRAADLGVPGPGDRDLRILAAARLGETRLIDNLPV